MKPVVSKKCATPAGSEPNPGLLMVVAVAVAAAVTITSVAHFEN
jgi:hypothetical protein